MPEKTRRKCDYEVPLELRRMVLEQAGGRRLSPRCTLALYHLGREAEAFSPEGGVPVDHLEDGLKRLLQ